VNICIVTLYTDEIAGFGRLGAGNKESYARRHGYGFAVYDRSLDPLRAPAFSKLIAIMNRLADHDWVFWTDADSLVMNPAIRLESIIRRGADKDMILTWEAGAARVNTGQWLIRNTDWSAAMLEQIGALDCPNTRPRWFEQGALIDWLNASPERWRHLAVLHPRVMNSTPAKGAYPDLDLRASRYRRGDFIIHFWPLARQTVDIGRAMAHYNQLALAPEAGLLAGIRKFATAARGLGQRLGMS
jgi:galactosyl transferase GMA12/MNN10 family